MLKSSKKNTNVDSSQGVEKLLDYLTAEKLTLVNAIMLAAPIEDEKTVLGNIVNLLDGCGKMKDLLKKGIECEVAETANPATLFRQNTATTKLMKGYTRLHGKSFLLLLRPIFDKIANSGWNLEVDPLKTQTADANLKHLQTSCEWVFGTIVDNLSKEISQMIHKAVTQKFPEMGAQSVGGYFFLRFICPAISAKPQSYGMLDPTLATPATLRNLLLISKNLSNKILFGEKETHMVPLNSFISANLEKCSTFLITMAKGVSGTVVPSSREEALGVALPELLRFLIEPEIKEKVLTYLEKNKAEVAGLGNFYNIVADLEKGHKELFKARPKVTWYHKLTTPKVSMIFYKMFNSETTLRRINEAFNSADKDRSGSIDKGEWMHVCVALLSGLSFEVDEKDPCISNFIDTMFELCDVNQDDRISMEEFRSYINKVAARVSIPDTLSWIMNSENVASFRMGFREVDKNGDGTLDKSEIKDMFVNSAYFRSNFQTILPSDETFEQVVEGFLDWFWIISDVDGNGRITFDELKIGLEKLKSGEYGQKR